MAWATSHSEWGVKDWKIFIFSDESKFNVIGSDGIQYCRLGPNEEFQAQNVQKRMKHGGGSIMVWGCITPLGYGRLHCIEGIMKKEEYCAILEESFLGTLHDYNLDVEDVIFQQDNDPKHTSKLVKEWFSDNGIEVLPWPANSPDMNPIEHVWGELERKVQCRTPPPTTKDQLWTALEEEWKNLRLDYLEKLYESMHHRILSLSLCNVLFQLTSRLQVPSHYALRFLNSSQFAVRSLFPCSVYGLY